MAEETKSPTPPSGPPHTAAPAKPTGPTPIPWDSSTVARLKSQYGSGVQEAVTYLGQNYFVLDASVTAEALRILRDEEQFDYCVDITAHTIPLARSNSN